MLFYLRYENRDLLIQLRRTGKELRAELDNEKDQREEFEQQNIILRNKVSELYEKNDDLRGVVSELSRYYYNIKVASTKLQDLAKHLQLPDEEIAHKAEEYSALYGTKKSPDADVKESGSLDEGFF